MRSVLGIWDAGRAASPNLLDRPPLPRGRLTYRAAVDTRPLTRDRHRPDLPPPVGFALWADAWLAGTVSLDDAHDAVAGPDVVHLVAGLPGQEAGPEPLILGLGRLRSAAAQGARVALPSPGDPVGLAGPPAFNQAALEQGGAVLLPGTPWGLVPVGVGSSLTWTATPARTDGPVLDPGEADRGLRSTLTTSATALAELDVARWSPDAADELMAIRRTPDAPWPPHVGPRAARTIELGLRCLRICDLALADAGGARTAAETTRRQQVLGGLSSVARRAVVAAVGTPRW